METVGREWLEQGFTERGDPDPEEGTLTQSRGPGLDRKGCVGETPRRGSR